MKTLARIGGLVALLPLLSLAQADPKHELAGKSLADSISQLAAEIRNLRLELIEQRLESQDQKLSALRSQLEKTAGERRRLLDREQSTEREMQELNERLNQSGVGQEERTQLEALRTTAITAGMASLRSERSSIDQEEARIREQLQREQVRRQALAKTAQQLKASGDR